MLIIAIICGLAPLGASLWWVFELTSHFRLQYAIPALVLLGMAIWHRRRILALPLTAVVLINLWPVLAYLPTTSVQGTSPFLSVLNVNVNASNTQHDETLELIRTSGADVVTLIELSPELDAQLDRLLDIYPHRVTHAQADNFGLGILSQHPLADSELLELGPTVAALAVLELPSQPLGVLAVHPVPPVSREWAAIRNDQLAALADMIRPIDEALIVCGDFNLSPYSPWYRKFVETSGARDLRLGQGLGFSWPSFMPLLGIPIDHCFARGALIANRIQRLAPFGSDHYPVLVELAEQTEP